MHIFNRKRCPVCGKYEFNEIGKYEICPICKWEDDPVQRKDHSYEGGANGLSLRAYRKAFRKEKKND